jgi:putative membrane protein
MSVTDDSYLTWKEAFHQSPGPRSLREAALLAIKGLCMGTADIIPGVSGGTIALITGIYESLLKAIGSVNGRFFKQICLFKFKDAVAGIHIRFLLSLLIGIGAAIISLARLMHYLLKVYPVYTWSLFLGLITASIFIVGRKVDGWRKDRLFVFFIGMFAAYVIVSMIPVSTPESFWFIFLSGFVAICAMILPGLSGAFILLILGKYLFITATLKNPFLPGNMLVILVFCSGCAAGLLLFSRVLNFFLNRFYHLTLAFLTGLMAGSMKKIWPWKKVIETKMIGHREYVLQDQNIFPETMNMEVLFAVLLIIIGFILVLLLDHLARGKKKAAR